MGSLAKYLYGNRQIDVYPVTKDELEDLMVGSKRTRRRIVSRIRLGTIFRESRLPSDCAGTQSDVIEKS